MKGRIYYFTGTGNSMRAARVVAEKLGDTQIVSMRCNPEDVPATDCGIVGFVYPVYHWTMPAHAAAFVEKLEIDPRAYVFGVAMPSLICGIACERLDEILAKKGIRLDYGNLVHCVANYAIVYPPFPSPKHQVPKMEKKIRGIAEDIAKQAKRDYPRGSGIIRRIRNRVMLPYLALQPYADYPFTIGKNCVSCGLCSRVCPCGNIRMTDGKPEFLHHCANCMACLVSCPKRAIGYDIGAKDRELLRNMSGRTPLVKIMGLPKGRKLYRNPYITARDLTKERESPCQNGEKPERES